jgi:hypothetical protein
LEAIFGNLQAVFEIFEAVFEKLEALFENLEAPDGSILSRIQHYKGSAKSFGSLLFQTGIILQYF